MDDDPLGGPTEILEKVLERYRAMKTFQCKMSVQWVVRTEDDEHDHDEPTDVTIQFEAPDRFRDVSDQLQVIMNQQKAWVYDTPDSYVELKAPENAKPSDLLQEAGYHNLVVNPVLEALCRRDASLSELTDYVATWKDAAPLRTDDTSYVVITGEMKTDFLALDQSLPFSVTVRTDSWLVEEIMVDTAEAYRSMMASAEEDEEENEHDHSLPKIEEAFLKLRYTDIQIDERIDEQQFTFVPPEGAKKVETLARRRHGSSDQLKLLGKPAPAFEGADVNGKLISLAEHKGKIVLLDFWATWCGPCVKAIPHIQKIAETYADRDVVVIGMNRDMEGSEEEVRKFLAKKKVTFRQFMDGESTAADAYAVRGIPCTVLIDKEGVIQWIKTGYGPGGGEEVAEKIDALLAGEQIYDAEEVEAQIAAADEMEEEDPVWSDDEDEDFGTNVVIAAVSEERLLLDGKTNVRIMRHNVRELDLDGDGNNEIIAPDWEGALSVVSSDGLSAEKVQFRGRNGRSSIQSFAPIHKEDGLYWLVSFVRHGASAQGRSRVEFYDPAGACLWTYDPELSRETGSDIAVDVADLDGDGTQECVIAVSSYKSKKAGQNSWMRTSLAVHLGILDLDGNVLSMKRIGKNSNFFRVVPSVDSNTATILVDVGGKLRRYRYDPAAQPDPVEVE